MNAAYLGANTLTFKPKVKTRKPAPEITNGANTASAHMGFAGALEAGGNCRYEDKVIYRWSGSSWQNQSQEDMGRIALKWLNQNHPDRASAKTAFDCVATAMLWLKSLPTQSGKTYIPLKGAWLCVASDGGITIVKPNPDERMTHELAVSINAPLGNYTVPALKEGTRFAKFLSSSLPDIEIRNLVQEYVGYTLLSDCHFHTAQLWVGAGRNGKSVLAHIVGQLHAKLASVALDKLNGFEAESIVGASLVICDEAPKNGIDETKFKTIVSGGILQINPKNRTPFQYRCHAKWIVCANHIPSTKDHSDGWWRRFQVIEWDTQIPEGEVIHGLENDIVKHELPEVLHWALEGLQRLTKRGNFAIPQSVMYAKQESQADSNSVLAWIRDADVSASTTHVTAKKVVFDAYISYCGENHLHACGNAEFFRRLYQPFPAVKENAKRVRSAGSREYVLPLVINVSQNGLLWARQPVRDDDNPFNQ